MRPTDMQRDGDLARIEAAQCDGPDEPAIVTEKDLERIEAYSAQLDGVWRARVLALVAAYREVLSRARTDRMRAAKDFHTTAAVLPKWVCYE